jgi:hypothetical protein
MSEFCLKRRESDPEYKLSCLISRLTGGLYSKTSMTLDQIMEAHEDWHDRIDEKTEDKRYDQGRKDAIDEVIKALRGHSELVFSGGAYADWLEIKLQEIKT